jgi:hypothetical protein
VVSKRQVVPQDERASASCLHCDINDLVQEHVEGLEQPVDIVALAANIADSLVDLILLAPRGRAGEIAGRNDRARRTHIPRKERGD